MPARGADDRDRAEVDGLRHRASSARTTWATSTSSCRRCTASTSSSATSITSTRWRTRAIRNYPQALKDTVGPRNMVHSLGDRHGRPDRAAALGQGRQAEDRGRRRRSIPKRMETVDDEILDHTFKFIDKAKADNKPFFVWLNPTRMHVVTHLSDKYEKLRNSENGWYDPGSRHGAARRHRRLGDEEAEGQRARRTTRSSCFTTDNGAENFTWPDGGQTPFAGGKGTALEGGFRVPCIVRWPGKVPAGKVENGIMSGLDWFPTFVAAAGNPNIVDELKKGKQLGDTTYKVHLDGYNQTGPDHRQGPSKRHEIFYFTEGTLWRGADRRLQVPLHRSARTAGSAARSRSTGRSWSISVSIRSSAPACSGHGSARRLLQLVRVRVLALRVRAAGSGEGRADVRSSSRRCRRARASTSRPSRRRSRRHAPRTASKLKLHQEAPTPRPRRSP